MSKQMGSRPKGDSDNESRSSGSFGAAPSPSGGPGKVSASAPSPSGGPGKASASSLSSDSTQPEWQQQAQTLQTQFADLQDDLMLTSVHSDLGRVESDLATLDSRLSELRRSGYLFANHLEEDIQGLHMQWGHLQGQVDEEVRRQSSQLSQESRRIQLSMLKLNNGQQELLPEVSASVRALNDRVAAARQAITGQAAGVTQGIAAADQALREGQQAMTLTAQASFPFLQGESVVAVTKAKLLGDNNEELEGLLILTDERLLFEQRQKVAKKKLLFVTLDSEEVQELIFTALLGWIENTQIQDASGGFLRGSKELLTLNLSRDASRPHVTFQLIDSVNESWANKIQRAKNGDVAHERVGASAAAPADSSAAAPRAALPSICPNCGAQLSTQVVRGQRAIRCDYCNHEIPL